MQKVQNRKQNRIKLGTHGTERPSLVIYLLSKESSQIHAAELARPVIRRATGPIFEIPIRPMFEQCCRDIQCTNASSNHERCSPIRVGRINLIDLG